MRSNWDILQGKVSSHIFCFWISCLSPEEHKAMHETRGWTSSKESNKFLPPKPWVLAVSTVPAGFWERTATANLIAEEEGRHSMAPPSAGPTYTWNTQIHRAAYFVTRHIHPSPASPIWCWSAECPPVPSYQVDTLKSKWGVNHGLPSKIGQETSLLNISLYSLTKTVTERKTIGPGQTGWIRIPQTLQR